MAAIATITDRSLEEQRLLENRIDRLLDSWKLETAVFSATWQMKAHPAFGELVAIGWDVVPSLLHRLDQPCVQWMMALCTITGEDPSSPEHAGRIEIMGDDWKIWGQQRGFLNGSSA